MNSVHEQCSNSDPKQCTVTKLGWVHSAHTQNPSRAHTALAVPMSWALLRAQQACRARSQRRSRAQRAQVARIAPRSWVHVATFFSCPAQARSRHHFQAATSWTTKPGRDIIPMSRPPFSQLTPPRSGPQMGSRHQLPWGS